MPLLSDNNNYNNYYSSTCNSCNGLCRKYSSLIINNYVAVLDNTSYAESMLILKYPGTLHACVNYRNTSYAVISHSNNYFVANAVDEALNSFSEVQLLFLVQL